MNGLFNSFVFDLAVFLTPIIKVSFVGRLW